MGYDKTLPTNSTKIRDYPQVLTSNFAAIEEADETSGTPVAQLAVLLSDRTTVPAANEDPVVVGATTYVYSRDDDTNGLQEAYVKNAAGNVIQVTQGDRLGSDITDIGFNTLSHDEGTTSYNEDNLITGWISVAANGTYTAGGARGLTSTKTAVGKYTISFSTAQLDTDYIVTLGLEQSPGNITTIYYNTKTVNDFKIEIFNNTPSPVDKPFSVMVAGGR